MTVLARVAAAGTKTTAPSFALRPCETRAFYLA